MEIVVRYVAMALVVIIGGMLHSSLIMALGVPIFLSAILGYCPLYQMLGINHADSLSGNEG
jgi:hypothetical protein